MSGFATLGESSGVVIFPSLFLCDKRRPGAVKSLNTTVSTAQCIKEKEENGVGWTGNPEAADHVVHYSLSAVLCSVG